MNHDVNPQQEHSGHVLSPDQRRAFADFFNQEPLTEGQALQLATLPVIQEATASLRRSDLLPGLFKIQGKQYSLEDYPQFRELYDNPYVPRTLLICGRQLGKSANNSRSEVADAMQIDNFHILYVAPLQMQTNYYSTTYLAEAIGSCFMARWLQSKDTSQSDAGPALSNVGHYSFNNGSNIRLTYAKQSPDRARGIFADRIDYDEIQDQIVDNLAIIDQSTSASDYALRRYTGTAKTMDNTIEFLWQDSSQAEWVVKCEGCNHHNIPDREHAMDMIRAQGPSCVKCGKKLNVRRGEFVPKFQARHRTFAGYHVPQIVVPAIVENPVRWMNLINKVLSSAPATVMQEILGISCSEGARLITEEDIKRNSTLPPLLKMQRREWLSRYHTIIGGVDWGVAEVNSYTVHTIIGLRSDGMVDVLWAKRFFGFDPSRYLKEIAQAQAFYGAKFLCADFGMGFEKNLMLQQQYGVPVVQFQYTGTARNLTFSPVGPLARWLADKVASMEILFWAIKANQIQFPPWAEFERLAIDLLSPFQTTIEYQGRQVRKFLRNPARPDDFCHALNFAYMGAKALLGHGTAGGLDMGVFGAQEVAEPKAPMPDQIDPLQNLRSLT